MMNSLMPNMRWLCLISENLGADWYEKCISIDNRLEHEGLDLTEDSVYLLYSDSPEKVLEGHAQCMIARSVVGPKKTLTAPFVLVDWKSAPVWKFSLQGETLTEILKAAADLRKNLEKEQRIIARPFSLAIRRELSPVFKISVESIFHE